MSWFVYILICENTSLYTGVTTDIKRRFNEHQNEKSGAKYTKANKPIKIVYTEECESRSDAQKRESEIKKMKKADKELLVENYKSKKIK